MTTAKQAQRTPMVGDDRRFVFDEDEITALEREEYCGVCGQIGCAHDGLDRDAA